MDFVFLALILVSVVVIGFTIFTVVESKKYKHRVHFRTLVKCRKILHSDVAKTFVDDSGVIWWKLKREKNKDWKLLLVPPPECVEIDVKGRKNVVVYRDNNGNVRFLEDNNLTLKDNKGFRPVDSEQRVVMVNQIRKARERGGRDWKQNLPMFVGGLMLVILVVVVFVFMEDVAKPFIKSKELQVQQQELLLEQAKVLSDIRNDVQTLKSNVVVGGGGAPD